MTAVIYIVRYSKVRTITVYDCPGRASDLANREGSCAFCYSVLEVYNYTLAYTCYYVPFDK